MVSVLLGVALSGCSVNTVIWGPAGARVIDTTTTLIQAAAAGEGDALICPGQQLDLGVPGQWAGLFAGEPEKFVAEYWPGHAELDPAWSINLSLPSERATAGRVFPGNVFYREVHDDLCVVGIDWSTVEG